MSFLLGNWKLIAICVTGAVAFSLAVYYWKSLIALGRKLGRAEEQADTSAAASEVQSKMGEAMAQSRTADELVDKWRKGGSL